MPATAVGPLILFLFLLLTAAHPLGHLFTRLRQPRVIGEILAGIILGPCVLGKFAAYARFLQLDAAAAQEKASLDLLYGLGLLLPMCILRAYTQALGRPRETKRIGW